MKTVAIIPVKRRESSNERLASVLSPESRSELAEAMFLDTLGNVRRSRRLDEILIVTADEYTARTAGWIGVDVLEQEDDRGHSEAAVAGVTAAMARGATRVVLLPADCPLLDPLDLDRRIGALPRTAVIVPDRHGTGTNALILSPPDVIAPAFGPDSCARHVTRARAAGISYAVEPIESLALDLDTPDDLAVMRETLVLNPEHAPRTAELIWKLAPESADRAAEAV